MKTLNCPYCNKNYSWSEIVFNAHKLKRCNYCKNKIQIKGMTFDGFIPYFVLAYLALLIIFGIGTEVTYMWSIVIWLGFLIITAVFGYFTVSIVKSKTVSGGMAKLALSKKIKTFRWHWKVFVFIVLLIGTPVLLVFLSLSVVDWYR